MNSSAFGSIEFKNRTIMKLDPLGMRYLEIRYYRFTKLRMLLAESEVFYFSVQIMPPWYALELQPLLPAPDLKI